MSRELTARGAPAQDLASLLTRFIDSETITPEKLDAVLRMRRELVDEERREQFQEAFAALQAELPQVPKTGIVTLKNGKYNFGKFEDIMTALKPLLSKYGFSVSFTVLPADNGRIIVRCILARGGYSTHGDSAPIPPDDGPGRNEAQAAGSSTTYGKRYALINVLNIVICGVDDDAISGGSMRISEKQVSEIQALLVRTDADVGEFLKFAGVGKLEEIPVREFPRLINALQDGYRQHLKKQQKAKEK